MAEERSPEKGTRLTAVEIHDNILEPAREEMRRDAEWGQVIGGFVLPAVIGNAIGGVLMVALLNYGQVAADKDEARTRE